MSSGPRTEGERDAYFRSDGSIVKFRCSGSEDARGSLNWRV